MSLADSPSRLAPLPILKLKVPFSSFETFDSESDTEEDSSLIEEKPVSYVVFPETPLTDTEETEDDVSIGSTMASLESGRYPVYLVNNTSTTPEEMECHPSYWLASEVETHKFTVLVFYKSASSNSSVEWLKEWNNLYSRITNFGGEILGISTNKVAAASKLKTSLKLKFPLVVDEECILAQDVKAQVTKRSLFGLPFEEKTFAVGVVVLSNTMETLYEWKHDGKGGWHSPRCPVPEDIWEQIREWVKKEMANLDHYKGNLKEPFERIIGHPQCIKLLHRFLEREQNGELLDYFLDMKRLEEEEATIHELYEKYIATDSQNELNLPSRRKEALREAYEQCDNLDGESQVKALFAEIYFEVLASLTDDAFPRFAQSPMFSVALEYLTRHSPGKTSGYSPDPRGLLDEWNKETKQGVMWEELESWKANLDQFNNDIKELMEQILSNSQAFHVFRKFLKKEHANGLLDFVMDTRKLEHEETTIHEIFERYIAPYATKKVALPPCQKQSLLEVYELCDNIDGECQVMEMLAKARMDALAALTADPLLRFIQTPKFAKVKRYLARTEPAKEPEQPEENQTLFSIDVDGCTDAVVHSGSQPEMLSV